MNRYLRAILRNPHEFLASGVHKRSSFFVKRYVYRGATTLLKTSIRRAPAQNAFERGLQLEAAKLPTPTPVAIGHRRTAGILFESVLVAQRISDVTELRAWRRNSLSMARSAAELVARLQSHGFLHRDLSLTNLVADAAGQIQIVDLDTMRQAELTEQHRMKELERFLRTSLLQRPVSRAHRLQFLIHYCRLQDEQDWKRWWRSVDVLYSAESARRALKAGRGEHNT